LTDRLPHTLLGRFHPEVRWVVGRTKACVEGCRENSEAIQEMLYNDYQGRGGWTLVCGSGFEGSDLDALPVPNGTIESAGGGELLINSGWRDIPQPELLPRGWPRG
jgi:hypothetical protein